MRRCLALWDAVLRLLLQGVRIQQILQALQP